MMELIDRQAAIDAIMAEVDDVDRPNVELRWWNLGLTRAIEILKQLPTAEPRAITPDKFRDKMIEILERDDSDTEMAHIYMDKFMCETLKLLGYGEGVEVFEKQEKWYS